jgi:hypothetical protein
MKTSPFSLALLLLSLHAGAHAQLYKCKGPDGNTAFQDTPCTTDAKPQARKVPVPGEKNEGFGQPKKDDGPGGNWSSQSRNWQDHRGSVAPPPPSQAQAAPARPATSPAASWQDQERDFQKRKTKELAQAQTSRDDTYAKSMRCNHARQQLGMLKEQGRLYSRDNNGDRHYLADENRASATTNAQQWVNEECH